MIIDTDVLVDYLRDARGACDWLASVGFQQRKTTVVSHMELLEGAPDRANRKLIRVLLQEQFRTVYPITTDIAETALQLIERTPVRSGLRLADALIAATCLVHHERLATWNQKHYRAVQGLTVVNPGYRV